MYFKDEFHEENFRKLEKAKDGGQENERISSLYVLSALPKWFLNRTKFFEEGRLDVVPLVEHPSMNNLSSGEKTLLNLAFVLFHGDYGRKVLLGDYLGYNNPHRELFMEAIRLNMPKK